MSEKIFLYVNEIKNIPVGIKYENISNIDNYNNNSIDHIIINDLLNYYEANINSEVLKLIRTKIAPDGIIEIQAPDINELCIAVASSNIDSNIVKSILYSNKKSIHTIYDICDMLNALGFKINQKKYVNIFEYYILAQKNET